MGKFIEIRRALALDYCEEIMLNLINFYDTNNVEFIKLAAQARLGYKNVINIKPIKPNQNDAGIREKD